MKARNSISISRSLADARAAKDSQRHALRRSAVALVLDEDSLFNASILMIQRAAHPNDPWSGQMAFPGGRKETEDPNAVATAKREMLEEVGFDVDTLSVAESDDGVIGRLSDISTAGRNLGVEMVVSPYVFLVERRPELVLNEEVADTVWIPLHYFADFNNRGSHLVERDGLSALRPCYQLSEDKIVWGMSLEMIDDLLEIMGLKIPEFDEGF